MRWPIRSLIIAVWLGLLAWFIRYDAFPGLFTGALDGYRGLLREGQVFADSWMQIRFREHAIGYSHTQIDMDEKSAADRYRVTSLTDMELNLAGEPQRIVVNSQSKLDAFQRLMSFDFSINARRYTMRIEAQRREGDTFRVRVRSDAIRETIDVRIPDDVIVYSPMTMMALGRMEPGDTTKLKTFDPASMKVAEVIVKALRREAYTGPTNTVDSTVLSVAFQGMEMQTWIDRDGQVLRQDTPFGWSMVACTPEVAMKTSSRNAADAGAEMLGAMAVPVLGRIPDADRARVARVRLHGLPFDLAAVTNARQSIVAVSSNAVDLRLDAAAVEPLAPLDPSRRAAALASSPFVQAADDAIVRKATEIVAGAKTDEEKALAIAHWVNKSVKKNLTASLPSAKDVLVQREGDCNEHTYLTVALARAAGLPAAIRVGIVYKDEGCFYHAWPMIHAGRWMELDPTLGLDALGVRHIALLEGELGEQAKLMGAMGRLRVEILEPGS